MLNTKITNKVGEGVRGWVYFEAVSAKKIDQNMAADAQYKLRYPVQGYGIYDLKVTHDPVLHTYKATWRCQASCD
jgi:hypothetical protein